MHNPLRPGIKPVSSALTGGFSSTAPPGKSRDRMSFNFCLWSVVLNGGELSPRGHLAVTFEGGHVHGILGVEAEYAIRWKHLTENKTALPPPPTQRDILDYPSCSKCNHVHVCMLRCFSRVQLFAIPWTVAHQAPLSMGFSRQEYWSGCHVLLQRIFPTQGSILGLLHCRQILYCWVTREVPCNHRCLYINKGQEIRGNVMMEEGGERYLKILRCWLWRWRKKAWVKGYKKCISGKWRKYVLF